MRRKLLKISVLFFIVMILFTILSRVTYNMSTATVETEQPVSQSMGPIIETKATVDGKQEISVSTKENQIIQAIHVIEGQVVEKGHILYTLDMKELNKQIQEKNQELELNGIQLANTQGSVQAAIDAHNIQIEQAKNDYDRAAAEGDAAIQRAWEEWEQASEMYEQYINSPESFPEYTEEQLKGMRDEKERTYQDAVKGKDNAVYSAQKAIDSASVHVPSDDTAIRQLEIDREKIETELKELQMINEQAGEIRSPADGVVIAIDGQVGKRTTGLGEIRVADSSAGARITAVFSNEYAPYIQRGQKVEIMNSKNTTLTAKKEQKELVIESVKLNDNQGVTEELVVTVDVPAGQVELGTSVSLRVIVPSENYDTCIPISALNVKEQGKYYVNVLEKKKTVLGEEWVVYRRDVELLFKNEKYAAVTGIALDEEIVTKSSRVLENGTHVKRKAS